MLKETEKRTAKRTTKTKWRKRRRKRLYKTIPGSKGKLLWVICWIKRPLIRIDHSQKVVIMMKSRSKKF